MNRQVRLGIEAAVVVGAAVAVGFAHLGRTADYAVVGAVWLAIALVEYLVAGQRSR
jgi:hypothetical protein